MGLELPFRGPNNTDNEVSIIEIYLLNSELLLLPGMGIFNRVAGSAITEHGHGKPMLVMLTLNDVISAIWWRYEVSWSLML